MTVIGDKAVLVLEALTDVGKSEGDVVDVTHYTAARCVRVVEADGWTNGWANENRHGSRIAPPNILAIDVCCLNFNH